MKTATLYGPDGTVLFDRVELALCWWRRMRGLLGRRTPPPPRQAMYIAPAPSIHTFFMAFDIDLVFVSRRMEVQKIVRDVRPGRLAAGGLNAWGVFELGAGWLPQDAIHVGDQLALHNISVA